MWTGWLLIAAVGTGATTPPVVEITQDNVVIRESCRVVLPGDGPIVDADGNGVVHIGADGITVEFVGAGALRGAAAGVLPDQYRGYGVMIAGQQIVTLRGARVRGFYCGVRALDCDGLVVEDCDLSDNWRQRLHSERLVESGRDWLRPHYNDRNQWLEKYGAALYVEDARDVTIRRNRVHHGQNGLILDRVDASKVYDNDFSFNSGWGVALWRCNDNVLSRNACDFNVRGYSHGHYNRGQDSAGFLVFEQCNRNVFAENSATHSGDGFFGFAGREALGRVPETVPIAWHKRRGNNDNLLVGNDFSYPPAHWNEMTFSFGNRFIDNRLVGNAICGVWGGYSQDTLIAGNELAENGAYGYGLERGGVNIDTGAGNRISSNTFRDNRCGVHLWWSDPERRSGFRWGQATLQEIDPSVIARNTFVQDTLALHLRSNVPVAVQLGENGFRDVEARREVEGPVTVRTVEALERQPAVPPYPVYGVTRPVGARPALRGREHIHIREWGPWDHASPAVFFESLPDGRHQYDVYVRGTPRVNLDGENVRGEMAPREAGEPLAHVRYTVRAEQPGVWPYTLTCTAGTYRYRVRRAVLETEWQVTLFTTDADPVENFDAWRAAAEDEPVQDSMHGRIEFFHPGPRAPRDVDERHIPEGFGRQPHGTRAQTTVRVPAGNWQVVAIADDGVRVRADGERLIDAWRRSWAPRKHTATLELAEARDVTFELLHFQRDNTAGLVFELVPAE